MGIEVTVTTKEQGNTRLDPQDVAYRCTRPAAFAAQLVCNPDMSPA